MLAVPDGAVAQAVELIEEDLGATTALVHCSGALPLAVFSRTKGHAAVRLVSPAGGGVGPARRAGGPRGGAGLDGQGADARRCGRWRWPWG